MICDNILSGRFAPTAKNIHVYPRVEDLNTNCISNKLDTLLRRQIHKYINIYHYFKCLILDTLLAKKADTK